MKKDFLCRCGHPKSDHKKPAHLKHARHLGVCYNEDGEYDKFYTDNCPGYRPDNLLYLELKAKERE